MKKAVFLDRDGTIIRDMVYLNDPDKIEIFQESFPALKLLHDSGFMIILVTNQSGVARGLVQEENVLKINEIIAVKFRDEIDAVIADAYYCPHPVDGGCHCCKPNLGMLEAAAEKHGIDLKKSWMVGDRMTDVEAGRRAGCRSILLQNSTTPPIDPAFDKPEIICLDVLEAATLIVERDQKTGAASDSSRASR